MSTSRRPALLAYWAGCGAILCWASLAAATGESLNSAPPEQVLAWGMGIAGATLALWDAARGLPPRRTWPGLRGAAWGVWGILGSNGLYVFAFSLAPRPQANVLNYTWPLWIVILGTLRGGHRFSPALLGGGLLGLAGVGLTVGGAALPAGGLSVEQALGLALALGAGFCWASYTVWQPRFVPPGPGRMAWFCLLSAAASAALGAARGVPLLPVPGQWGALVYIGLVPLGVAYQLWDYGARHGDLRVLGLLSYFIPPLSTLLLALVSGAPLGAGLLAGLALILAGCVWAGRALRGGK
jgi:drug/metabolite transporter (DMT)-like permease